MPKKVSNWTKNMLAGFNADFVIYVLLAAILVIGFLLRIYRINELLGFYYDQGRDALKIWDLWHKSDLFLVGPTTGIAGILRGPYYYYLIAPFYLFGGGNPIWPSVFLSFTTIIAAFVAYYLGRKIHGQAAGIIAALISSLSFNIVMASRWLSNPTPMLLFSLFLVLMMVLVTEGKNWAWIGISFLTGLSLFHFGSSGELFYLLAILIFAIWMVRGQGYGKKNTLNNKILLYSLVAFLLTVLPLIIFDIKNSGLILGNIRSFLFEGESFRLVTWGEISDRFDFYYDVFSRLIFHGMYKRETIIFSGVVFYFFYELKTLWKLKGVRVLILLLTSLVFGFTFFQGNFGNIYDYYLTGYFLIFILLFSITLAQMARKNWGRVFLVFFFAVFLQNNSYFLRTKLTDKVNAPTSIALKNQLQAVNWVFENASGGEFNIDVYVPPVIPYTYDYLFLWQGNNRCGENLCGLELEEPTETLYTLYEEDPPHPERLEAWLDRQVGIGEIEEEMRFYGITVQRRKRI